MGRAIRDENGKIKEAGTHDQLMALNGSYSKFYLAHEQINTEYSEKDPRFSSSLEGK